MPNYFLVENFKIIRKNNKQVFYIFKQVLKYY